MKIGAIFYNFYNSYIERELDGLIATSGRPRQLLVPFRVINHDKMFLPYACTFRLLPSLSNGVKYIISFADRK